MTMKYTKILGAMAVATAVASGYASAELQGEVHVGLDSSYIWRGMEIGGNMSEAGVDLAYNLGEGFNISGGAWYANFDANTRTRASDNEVDLYTEVSKDFGFATMSVGYIYYDCGRHGNLLRTSADLQEVYFSLSRELFWGIKGTLSYYWDIVGDNGGYSELGLQKTFELSPCLTCDVGVKTGYFVEEGQLGHVTAMVALNWSFAKNMTLTPYIARSWELPGLESVYSPGGEPIIGRAVSAITEENQLWGGLKLTMKF